jgi:hypothetical protein
MLLNIRGTNLKPVEGPQHTSRYMRSITVNLQEAVPVNRGDILYLGGDDGPYVTEYGDYTVITIEGPGDILGALDRVREDRRPEHTPQLEALVKMYQDTCPRDSLILGCFNSSFNQRHPLAFSYTPHDPDVLAIPALDGHDGKVPVIGQPVARDFKVAFSCHTMHPTHVDQENAMVSYDYDDEVSPRWAPTYVVGFKDNRPHGPNGDYRLRLSDVRQFIDGPELVGRLLPVG